jgi:hypothetical protein
MESECQMTDENAKVDALPRRGTQDLEAISGDGSSWEALQRSAEAASARVVTTGGGGHACPGEVNEYTELFGILGTRAELATRQKEDSHIAPIIALLESSNTKPQVGQIVQFSVETKRYWGQWDSLQIMGGVL